MGMYPNNFTRVKGDMKRKLNKPALWRVTLCIAFLMPFLTGCEGIDIPPPEPFLIESKFADDSLNNTSSDSDQVPAKGEKPLNNSPTGLVISASEEVEEYHNLDDGIYHLVLFTTPGSNYQEQITALVNQELQSILVESGAYHEVQTIFDNAPTETSYNWAVSALGGKIGLFIEINETGSEFFINPLLIYPDQELHLGDGSRNNEFISSRIVKPFEATSIAAGADYLANRLGIILNTYIGYESLNHGDFAECTRRFNSTISLIQRLGNYPELNSAAHESLGTCLLGLGRTEEASDIFASALVLNPESTAASYYLGKLNIDVSEFQLAEEYFLIAEKNAETDPLSSKDIKANIAASLGFIALADGRYEEAVDHFDKSINLMPDNAKNFYNRGRAKMAVNLLDAGRDFEQCLYLLSIHDEASSEDQRLANDCSKSLEQIKNNAKMGQGIQVISLPTYVANNETAFQTPLPTSTLSSEAENPVYYKVREEFSSVNVRSGPDQDFYPVIGYFFSGNLVPVYAKTEDGIWYLIAMENEEPGWMMSILLEPNDGTSGEISIVTTVPAVPSPSSTPQPTVEDNELPFNPVPTVSISQPAQPSDPPSRSGGLNPPRTSSPPANSSPTDPQQRPNPPAPPPEPPDPGPPRIP